MIDLKVGVGPVLGRATYDIPLRGMTLHGHQLFWCSHHEKTVITVVVWVIWGGLLLVRLRNPSPGTLGLAKMPGKKKHYALPPGIPFIFILPFGHNGGEITSNPCSIWTIPTFLQSLLFYTFKSSDPHFRVILKDCFFRNSQRFSWKPWDYREIVGIPWNSPVDLSVLISRWPLTNVDRNLKAPLHGVLGVGEPLTWHRRSPAVNAGWNGITKLRIYMTWIWSILWLFLWHRIYRL